MLSAMSGIQLISSSTPLIQGYSVAASIRAHSLTVISGYESDSPMAEKRNFLALPCPGEANDLLYYIYKNQQQQKKDKKWC